MGPGLTRNLFLENRPKIALNQYWYFGVVLCIFCLYTLLKVVGYYDLSVLSMSVKISLDGVGRWGELYPNVLEFYFAKPLSRHPTYITEFRLRISLFCVRRSRYLQLPCLFPFRKSVVLLCTNSSSGYLRLRLNHQ